jgi:hypothetical protein
MSKPINLEILKPTADYLTHPLVLAQAWKKSHQYIRRTSWLADTFDLDRSAILLDENLKYWASDLKKTDNYFSPLSLVPAPKTDSWGFHRISHAEDLKNSEYELGDYLLEGTEYIWAPLDIKKPSRLRPLAHVGIREQTYMTALMMSVANKVETLQGNTSTLFENVHEKNIVNYGNRLYCNFIDDYALFSWGSSNTYSQYFEDYKRFLERPKYFARQERQSIMPDEVIYEVHLDFKQFYDCVNRDQLIRKIKSIADGSDKVFDGVLSNFRDWKWKEGTKELYEAACLSDEGIKLEGIPQGLVSGGFWANVYLMDFDEWLANQINKELCEGIRLVDYCRYVDDMRLVIASIGGKEPIEEFISNSIGEQLNNLGLKLNPDKTKIETFKKPVTNVSVKLKSIQEKVSGPLSANELDEQLGHLEGLIGLASSISHHNKNELIKNPLANIEGMALDVREDTLLRFSANKIHTLLSHKRNFIAQEVDDEGKPLPGDWDYLQERMARKFITCWSRDPSLLVMLKKGLEMYPDPKILKPILSQLQLVLERKCKKQSLLASYCISEIFRHAATTINNKSLWSFPAHANVDSFYSMLLELADDLLNSDNSISEYFSAQAKLLLLVRNKLPIGICEDRDLYKLIYQMKLGMRDIDSSTTVSDTLVASVLAFQLARDKISVIESLDCLLLKVPSISFLVGGDALKQTTVPRLLKQVAKVSTELFENLMLYGVENNRTWTEHCKTIIKLSGIEVQAISGDLNRFNSNDKKEIGLLGVIKRSDNPFRHENSILLLIKSILTNPDNLDKDIDVTQVRVGCDSWSDVTSLMASIRVIIPDSASSLFGSKEFDFLSDEELRLYRLGMLIRTCLLGRIDWSASGKACINEPGYRGVMSSFYKRRIGMMHSPESLQGNAASMTGWLSSLLSYLLKWPGIKPINDLYVWPKEMDAKSLKKLVDKRIDEQKKNFCTLSNIPGYVEKVKLGWPDDKKELNVVMVQSLLPQKSDFDPKSCLLSSASGYRTKHRRHVASVAELILHKVVSQNSINEGADKRKSSIDLIVWPELAVDENDIDILNRLSDKTGAMIYAGLNFIQQPNVVGPNNCAIWIVPKKTNHGRHFLYRLQGKYNMTKPEQGKIVPWRPYQLMIELVHPAFPDQEGFKITGSICYDATDIKLNADLKGKSNAYVVSALNQDVATFDSMVDALYYHMYQYVVLVNTGEFGGSVAKAPYKERHEKLITHVHGANQVSISSFEMNMFDFRDAGAGLKSGKVPKTKPAG